MIDILLMRIALSVSPEPRAFPTRAHTAAWTAKGNFGFIILQKNMKEYTQESESMKTVNLRYSHRELLKLVLELEFRV